MYFRPISLPSLSKWPISERFQRLIPYIFPVSFVRFTYPSCRKVLAIMTINKTISQWIWRPLENDKIEYLSRVTEMSIRLTTSRPSASWLSRENVGASTPHNLTAFMASYGDSSASDSETTSVSADGLYSFSILGLEWDWVHVPHYWAYFNQIPDNDDDICGAVAGMTAGTGNGITPRELVPVSPQYPWDLIWDRTRTAAVGSLRYSAASIWLLTFR
jgi:hypothetical protein